ncbi:MAG: hypothetical protein ACI935_003901, partial [Moritella dasanensis]
MYGLNKTILATLISAAVLVGCNSEEYDEPL